MPMGYRTYRNDVVETICVTMTSPEKGTGGGQGSILYHIFQPLLIDPLVSHMGALVYFGPRWTNTPPT